MGRIVELGLEDWIWIWIERVSEVLARRGQAPSFLDLLQDGIR